MCIRDRYNDDAYFAETNSVINRVVERTSVSVEKKWEVEAKDSAEVKLFADDKEVDKFTLNNANSWKHTFKNLPKYSKEDNHEISYTIKETPIEGYNTKITGSAKDGFVVTGTLGGTKASKPGSVGLVAKYYQQAAGTAIQHTMNGEYGLSLIHI